MHAVHLKHHKVATRPLHQLITVPAAMEQGGFDVGSKTKQPCLPALENGGLALALLLCDGVSCLF
jgi:hypothetical protein